MRLRDAYLEPWGAGYADAFELAMQTGGFANVFGWLRQRDHLPPAAWPRCDADANFSIVLRHAIAQIVERGRPDAFCISRTYVLEYVHGRALPRRQLRTVPHAGAAEYGPVAAGPAR